MLKKIFLCLFFSFVFVLNSNAQDKDKTILLKTIIDNLQKEHKVTFNYIEEELAIFKIIPPNKNLSLDEKIAYISIQTKLDFKYITSNYISVYNNKRLDKPLCGYVKDATTNKAIEFATIRITGTNYSTICNELGYFEIQIKSPNNIEITHVNYEKNTLTPQEIYKEDCPEITLKPIISELNEVTTQFYLTKGISKKLDGTFEIKPKRFGLLPGLTEPDVFETLKQIPGIFSTEETISNISVRGGTHDQNLFLWNGIRLFQTGHFFGLISALNPNLAHTISITKNGSSPFYGESVSSVIDISTHSSNLENSMGSVGINMINADVYAKIKTSKTSNLEISGRRSFTDMVNSPTYKSYYNRIFQNTAVINLNNNELINYSNDENFYFYDFTVQFHQKINDKSDLYIDAITVSNRLDLTESKVENGTTISKTSNLEQQTIGGNVSYKINWNKNNQTDISAYGSYYSILSENESIGNNQIFNQENTILDTGFRLKNEHQLNENIKFKNGYQVNEIGIRNFDRINTPLFSRKIKDVLINHAAIGELQYESKDANFKTSLGFRANYIQQLQEFLFEPRLQLNYSLSNHFQLELLAESKSQTTSQIVDLQQDFLGIEKRRWILANNKNIPIEKNKQVSAGITFKKKNWLITLESFYKIVTGITSMSQGFQNQLEFSRINGDYRIYGSEFLIQKQFKRVTTWLSYTYNNNEYTFTSFSTNAFPNNFEINHNVGMAVIYDYKKLKIALGSRWFTGKPNTIPSSNTPIYNTPETPEIAYTFPNSSHLEDYFQMNISSSYSFSMSKNTKLVFGFSIQNILDSKNIINQNYRINQNTNSIEQVNTYSLERTPNAFLRFHF